MGDIIRQGGASIIKTGDNLAEATRQALIAVAAAASIPAIDIDPNLAANSDSRLATQKATKTYVDLIVTSAIKFQGALDCSANPNYPAATKGWAYVASVAGIVGGASGVAVVAGDLILATATNAGGTQAAVGASWTILPHNLQGALLSANNLADIASPPSARANLGLGAAAVLPIDTDPMLVANSDGIIATQKAAKTYVDLSVKKSSVPLSRNRDDIGDFSIEGTDRLILDVDRAGQLRVGSLSLYGSGARDGDGWLLKFLDDAGRLALGVDRFGVAQAAGLNLVGVRARDGDGWLLKFLDDAGRLALGVGPDGAYTRQSSASLAGMELDRYTPPSNWTGAARAFNIRTAEAFRIATIADAYDHCFDAVQLIGGAYDTGLIAAAPPIRGVLVYGQSNAMADSGLSPPLMPAPAYPHEAVMPNGYARITNGSSYPDGDQTDIIPAQRTPDEIGAVGDSPANLFATAMSWRDRRAKRRSRGTLVRTVAQGGTAITLFLPATQNYANALIWPGLAPNILTKYGRAYSEDMVIFVQGETPSGSYQADLQTLFNALPGALKTAAVAGGGKQALSPQLLYMQVNSSDAVVLDQLAEARIRSGSRIAMAGPMYCYEIKDTIHAANLARMRMADTLAYITETLEQGGSFDPLWPTSVTRSGAQITITFNKDIEFDTDLVAATTNYGFTYTDAGTPPAISSVIKVASNQITVTLASTPTGSTKKIRYAMDSGTVTAGWIAARGQVRSMETFASAFADLGFGVPTSLHHYCVKFEQTVS